MRYLPKIASILLLWMASQGASAYNYILCGNGTPVYDGEGVRTFQEGSNLFDSEVTATIQAFSRLSAFSAGSATLGAIDYSPALGNGENEVWWDSSVGTAICNTWWNNNTDCNVIESDIRIGDETWYTVEDSTHWPYGASGRSVQGVMVHEGGHCIGLGHTNNLYNIMGQEWTHVNRNNTTTYYGPGEDASDGLIDLHGERSGGSDTYRDVGVTTWRYDAPSGAYSAHKQGRLLDAGGIELTKTGLQWEGQDEYTINAGDGFRMEATYENNGEMNTEYPAVSFYLSTNAIISTIDTPLLTPGNYTLGRGSPFEYTETGLTIPVATAPGDYFVGVIVDSDYTIPETTDANNYAHYPITIPPPDLTVTAPSVSDTTPTTTQTITGYATINNVGGAQSAATTLRYYRSTNSTISTADTQVDTDSQAILNPGDSIIRSEPFIFSATPGTYWYGACVDTVAGETVTNNQCSSGVQVTVASPDLVVINPGVNDSTLLPGELFTIGATVKNQGTASSGATTLRYYRSTDSTISTSDTELGTDAILALSPSATSAQTLDATAPASDGTYWVGACVDAVAGESSTSNQCSTGVEISVESPLFADVPPSYWAYDFIQTFALAGITSGCGGGNYCPDGLVTRAEMAIFLERSMKGGSYAPPAATGTVFNDVPMSYWAASWIEQLFADGITSGCGGGNYCPYAEVARDQMAVFVLRAKHGALYSPPPATGTMFLDVDASYWAASWIEQLANEGISTGCGGGNYCPDMKVTRAQMAVFLVRAMGM